MVINMKKHKFLLVFLFIVLVLLLTVGVPFLINWLYSLPPVIHTRWSAANVLAYYGTLLGAAAGIFTLYVTICDGLWKFRTDYRLQCEMKMWQDIDEMFQQCISEIHPSKLDMLLLTSLPDGNPYTLITETVAFRVTVTTTVDRLVSSVQNISDPDLHKLKNQLVLFKKKLLSVVEQYSALQQNTILDSYKSRSFFSRLSTTLDISSFAKERAEISTQIQTLYDTDYCNLMTSREDFFRKKKTEISDKSNKTPLHVFLAQKEDEH